ncbi:MAG: hypothetical protein KF768_03995 [Phycisphaeraceae bacterium]|nr:hypothetical protein [Phycisphaeraceae bacterium]
MDAINISGYLTEDKLASVLQVLLGSRWLGRQVKSGKGKSTWDMAYVIDGVTTAVEYDGDDHYCNTLKIKADREKTAFAAANAIQLIRIPFWVQLTKSTLVHYFQIHADIVQTFSHGFITTKCFPASFCELGIDRFRAELLSLPSDVKAEVVKSLKDRVVEHGAEYVLPSSLRSLVDRQ